MIIPADLRYTREHSWARLDPDGRITVGITDFIQEDLGDIVSIDLPSINDAVEGGEPMGEIQSENSVWDLYSPVSGQCSEINIESKDNPAAVNQDPYGEGWLAVVDPSDPGEFESLMPADDYAAFLEEEA